MDSRLGAKKPALVGELIQMIRLTKIRPKIPIWSPIDSSVVLLLFTFLCPDFPMVSEVNVTTL